MLKPEKIIFLVVLIAVCSFNLRASRAANVLQISNPDGGQVRALVIGIDDYQHVRKLKGATADARDIESTLQAMGVQDITALINDQADRSSVLREISALVERTKTNDLIFLSIAGHGTEEPERIKGSEPDGMEDVFSCQLSNPRPADRNSAFSAASSTILSNNSNCGVRRSFSSRTLVTEAAWRGRSIRARQR